jgi:hypothetical protein
MCDLPSRSYLIEGTRDGAPNGQETDVDDHTFLLLHDADQKIRRAGLLIELHRLHMLQVKDRRRGVEQSRLNRLIGEYVRLLNYRQALLAEPTRAHLN